MAHPPYPLILHSVFVMTDVARSSYVDYESIAAESASRMLSLMLQMRPDPEGASGEVWARVNGGR